MIRDIWLATAILLMATSGSAAAEPATIPLRPYVSLLRTIDVEIDGRPARMLFDTGAGLTAITPEFAAEIGCAPYGAVTGFRMNGERVTFQRCPDASLRVGGMTRGELAVFDLGSVLPAELPELDGVIGLDVFDGHTITILPELSGIRIESRTSVRHALAGLRPGRARIAREAAGSGLTVLAPAPSALGDVWLLLDSANLAGLRLHPWAHEALSASSQQGAGVLTVDGAEPWRSDPEIVATLIYDGALDARFLAAHAITIDLARGRIWWRPAARQ